MPRLFLDTSRSLIYASLCYEIRKVKEILCGSDCTWQESLICGKRMTICPRRHKKEKYSDHCVFVEYFVWPSITKVQSYHADWGEKKKEKRMETFTAASRHHRVCQMFMKLIVCSTCFEAAWQGIISFVLVVIEHFQHTHQSELLLPD